MSEKRSSVPAGQGVRRLRTAVLAVIVTVAGCGAESATTATDRGSAGSSGPPSGSITVFAAASLTTSVTTLARAFETARPGVRVRLNFGGSSALASSIVNGAPADLFAAASTATMATVTDAGEAAGEPVAFARNGLQIATPPGNPRRIRGLADVVRNGVSLAVCAPQVPCGAAAGRAFAAAGLRARPVTLESDVKAVLTKVRLGEVDAGLVYRTDVLDAAGKVSGVAFPEAARALTSYPVVALKASRNPRLADAFRRYLLSAAAAQVFRRASFLPP